MITSTFFDLQRFADDTLVSGAAGYTWKGGSSFAGRTEAHSNTVEVGSVNNPAHLDTAPAASSKVSITGTSVYLAGDGNESNVPNDYSFGVEGKDWEVAIKDRFNKVHLTGNAIDAVDGTATLNVAQGEVFKETVNGAGVYIKQADTLGNDIVVSDSDTGATYTFAQASEDSIGVASGATAVITANGENVYLRATADERQRGRAKFNITGTVVVTSENDELLNIEAGGGDIIVAGDETWAFNNAATITADDTAQTNVTKVELTDRATLTTAELDRAVDVNDVTWNSIESPNLANVEFNSEGDATINTGNRGEVTVSAEALAEATFDTITTAGVVANNATIEANAANVTALLGDTGIAEVVTATNALTATVSGDEAFFVTVNDGATTEKNYAVATTADKIAFYAHDTVDMRVSLEAGEGYTVEGGDGFYGFVEDVAAKGTAAVTINGADIAITNNSVSADSAYRLTSEEGKEGVEEIRNLKQNDAVVVNSDADGYKAIFAVTDTSDNVLTFSANGATLSMKGSDVLAASITLDVDSSGDILVQGIDSNAIVTVSGGATYHFYDEKKINTVVADKDMHVSLVNGLVNHYDQEVDDYRHSETQPGVTEDDKKWEEVSTIGSATDTVNTHHSNAYEAFYNLDGSAVSGNTVAGYVSDNDENPGTSEDAISIIGDTVLGEAAHVTLKVGTGDHVGDVPLNIQDDESDNVVDVKIDLTASDKPSTVAIGTTGGVAASHEVSLSNESGGYVYVGKYATGENKIFGGSGADMIRHEAKIREGNGTKVMATLVGGAGNDTIRGDENDVVVGGEGADYFFDTAKYALDYTVTDDVIVATRIKSFDELEPGKIRGKGNQIGFGDGQKLLTLSSKDPNEALEVKVALLDDDGNVLAKDTEDLVLANGNGVVSVGATFDAATTKGARVYANSIRGGAEGVHTVIGSAYKDTIYVGANDIVDGAEGNDSITIDESVENVVVALSANTGLDTVSGWNFGFDVGKTVLDAGGAQVRARVYEDMLHISLEGATAEDAILFGDTTVYGANHGQYDVLVGDKKYTAIRNNGDVAQGQDQGYDLEIQDRLNGSENFITGTRGYASISSNDDVADFYVAERNGIVFFDGGVTKQIGENGVVTLGSENFWGINDLTLNNNSKTSVIGSDARETVSVGGAAIQGANKAVSLYGGDDVILSNGDDSISAGHKFYFGAGDGRDTIYNYSHYQGVDNDPDKQMTDTIILQSYTGLKVDQYEGGARIEIGTTAEDRVVVYEADGIDIENKTYNLQVGFENDAKLAKIGYSEGNNNFTYDKKIDYYVGASGDAHDTLTISDASENVEVWLDGSKGDFYRGIDVIDAQNDTYTNISLAGSADNNTIIAGGEGTTNFLWGGAGDNSLVGKEGIDYFLYYQGSANYVQGAASAAGNHDTIEGYNCETDFIYLGDITIDDIDVATMSQKEGCGITTDAVTVNFKNGGSLTVNVSDQKEARFYMNNGAVYSAQREDGAWHHEV